MPPALDGTVALVTGASSGIGEATAKELASLGAKVAVAPRRLERLERLASEIGGAGHTALAIEADITDQEQAIGAVDDDALARGLAEGRTALSEADLTRDFLAVPSDRSLLDLLQLVGRHAVPLAVVDDRARMLGVVPRAAVLDALSAVPARPDTTSSRS